MAKSFNHANHWQFQQLKKLQKQHEDKMASNLTNKCLPGTVHSAVNPTGLIPGMLLPPSDELRAVEISKETSTEPIVALRVWNIEKRGGKPYLRSAFKTEFVWPYRKALEQDIAADAGIHAVKAEKDWGEISPAHYHYLGFSGPQTVTALAQYYKAPVMGEVYLWGRVQEHAQGYLAQFAYPKRLWVSPKMDVLTWMELEHEYGVPCDTHDALDPAKWKPSFDDYYQSLSAPYSTKFSTLYPGKLITP